VLEGSVLAGPSHVRVNVQLIDAVTDEHLWTERFDKERGEVLEIQDEIVGRLSRTIGFQIVRSEAARPYRGGTGTVDLVMRARFLVNDAKRRENVARAIDMFRQALELDPGCVDAMLGIALARIYQVINLYRLEGRGALLDEAEDMLIRATALSPDHFEVLKARSLLLRARGRFAEAIVATEAFIARHPGEPTAYKEIGLNKLYLGATQEAVEWFRRADTVAPRDPERWTWLQGLGRALMQLGHDAEAADALRAAMDSNPGHLRGKAWLTAAEALSGDEANARRHLAEYLAVEPEMTVERFAGERSSVPLDVVNPVYRREIERIFDGLRRAGMPEGNGGHSFESIESETIGTLAVPHARPGGTGGPSLIARETALSVTRHDEGERRQITAMSCGVIGMPARPDGTNLEDLLEAISAFQHCVSEIVGRRDGFIASRLGNTVLVVFGYPSAHEHDAERAIHTGLELCAAVRTLRADADVPMRCRVGIATGMVIVGALVKADKVPDRGIFGGTPDLAVRLQVLAEPDTVAIESTTWRLIGNLFDCHELGPLDANNDAEATRRWQVLGESLVASRFEALRGSKLTPLVGRDEEIELLLRRWAHAKAGEGQIILLSGEAGIGKSRIAEVFEERLSTEPHLRLRYFCSPYHQDSALFPVIDQLSRAAEFAREDSPASKLEKSGPCWAAPPRTRM
jgi:class 3 adenylate cyclase